MGGFFLRQLIKAILDRRFARVFCLVSVLVRLFASQARMDLFSSSGVCSSAFLQPLLAESRIDNAGWWTQMPFHTLHKPDLCVASGLGVGLSFARLMQNRSYVFWLARVAAPSPDPGLCEKRTLPAASGIIGSAGCIGHDMLKRSAARKRDGWRQRSWTLRTNIHDLRRKRATCQTSGTRPSTAPISISSRRTPWARRTT